MAEGSLSSREKPMPEVRPEQIRLNNLLLDAVSKRDKEGVLQSLQNGADINCRHDQSNRECTPIHIAAREGYLDMLQILVNSAANINIKDRDRRTPLHHAASEGHKDIVQFLISHHADTNSKDAFGRTPLNYGYIRNYADICLILQEANSTLNYNTLLLDSCYYGYLEKMVESLDQGADIHCTRDNWTPLHLSSMNGHSELVTALLQRGANPEIRDTDQWTPIHLAARNGLKEVVKILADHGADITASDEDQQTPLHAAVGAQGLVEVVQLLISAGANPAAKDKLGNTPLHLACQGREFGFLNANVELVSFLLSLDTVDSTTLNNDGQTPLDLVSPDDENKSAIFQMFQSS